MSAKSDYIQLKERRAERAQKLERITPKLKAEHLIFANNILDGMNVTDAFRKISPNNRDCKNAGTRGAALSKRKDVQEYIEIMKAEAVDSAMHRVQFNEEDWLRRQLEIQSKSLGEVPIKKAVVINGEIIEQDVFEDNLTQANKTQELLGKRFSLLTDKQETTRTTLNIKDMTGRKPKTKSAEK